MDSVYKSGLMELSIKEIGRKTKPVVKVSLPILMETLTKDNGKMIRQTGLVFISILKPVLDTRGIGKTI